jgi:hypothetical protein
MQCGEYFTNWLSLHDRWKLCMLECSLFLFPTYHPTFRHMKVILQPALEESYDSSCDDSVRRKEKGFLATYRWTLTAHISALRARFGSYLGSTSTARLVFTLYEPGTARVCILRVPSVSYLSYVYSVARHRQLIAVGWQVNNKTTLGLFLRR